jgi:predicted O-methyltransferase YrrM
MSLAGQCYYAACSTRVGRALARGLVGAMRRLGGRRRFHMPLDALRLDHRAVAELMRLWSRIHWSSGDGMMPAEQLLAVYRLAATWPARGDTVELGAWVGLTTSYLATACRVRGEGKVYAVDTFKGTREGDTTYPSIERHGGDTLRAFEHQMRRAGVESEVQALVGLTTDVASRYPGRAIRMLLIDADHSYEGVSGDFETWAPHVVPGGLIVFHDYLMADVARFVDGVVRGDPALDMTPGQVVPNVFAVTKRATARRAEVMPHRSGSPREARFAAGRSSC